MLNYFDDYVLLNAVNELKFSHIVHNVKKNKFEILVNFGHVAVIL